MFFVEFVDILDNLNNQLLRLRALRNKLGTGRKVKRKAISAEGQRPITSKEEDDKEGFEDSSKLPKQLVEEENHTKNKKADTDDEQEDDDEEELTDLVRIREDYAELFYIAGTSYCCKTHCFNFINSVSTNNKARLVT